ncbi:MAG: RNA-binding transcriptional accessory protein [Thermoanaerobacteraceae bacterium]|nr:RNA-binding transcriptional accessory protein [Thermoanaerobacteraceae bacterium]
MLDILSREFAIPKQNVQAVIKLLKEGNTIPFIARYRKEMTGGLDDQTLRQLAERLNYLEKLEQRKQEILQAIDKQGKLTGHLEAKINKADTLAKLEDLYRPYKQKKSTRAAKAREKGLEPLAEIILAQDTAITEELLAPYVNPHKELTNTHDCLQGALDIIAEWVSDNADLRQWLRDLAFKEGILATSGKEGIYDSPYRDYNNYRESVSTIPAHRILAVNRAEKEEFLTVSIHLPWDKILAHYEKHYIKETSACAAVLREAITDALKRLILPAIKREVRSTLTEKAERQAIRVFRKNLHKLLLQAPVIGKKILAIDPGYRTGCKVAAVDEFGNLLTTATIYPNAPQYDSVQAAKTLLEIIEKHGIDLIAIGNGTASQETKKFVASLIQEHHLEISYTIVNEAGASVYSASEVAREEFPDLDVSLRSAVSLARRLQDPLAELVKIDPKAIGVGQYQHDVNQKALTKALEGVVEDCVNSVGVNLNTASAQLLQFVAGLTPAICSKIIQYRETNGFFSNRKQLLDVPGLGPKTFEQCAGFLRIPDGNNPLDNTAVHPESYAVVQALSEKLGKTLREILGDKPLLQSLQPEQLASELEVGLPTLKDILQELQKPGRDPREDRFPPLFRQDILELDDLKPGMQLQGVVRNVVDFGAFVDIGVHQDGLIHISQLSESFVKHPLDVVNVGDIVTVTVLDVDVSRRRISLSLIAG